MEQCGNGYLLLMNLIWKQNGDAVLGIVRMLAPLLDTVCASAGSTALDLRITASVPNPA